MRRLMSKAEAGRGAAQSPYAARPWLGRYDYWVRPHMNYPRRPLHEILRLAAAEVPDRPATAFLGAHMTFAQIKEQSDRLAAALHALGVRKNSRVGIMQVIVTSVMEYSAAGVPCPEVMGTQRLADLLASVGEPDLPSVEIEPED